MEKSEKWVNPTMLENTKYLVEIIGKQVNPTPIMTTKLWNSKNQAWVYPLLENQNVNEPKLVKPDPASHFKLSEHQNLNMGRLKSTDKVVAEDWKKLRTSVPNSTYDAR